MVRKQGVQIMRYGKALAATLLISVSLAACTRTEVARPIADPTSKRVTQSGELMGFTGQYGSHAWLGIPYAKPPVGALRWRAPQPPTPWAGTREALSFGSPCTQYASTFGGVTDAKPGTPVGSEDCLYLNIWAPRVDAKNIPRGDDRLPVMLWFHGGGHTIGEGGFYNGGNLAATQNVIVITMNYRLGPFGWFRHAALRGEGTSEADRSGNFGTLDLIRALEWTHENIAAFGGDPDNVTIFGESAGGMNVFNLLVSTRAEGLFHRAIAQSGSLMMDSVAEAENFIDDREPGHKSSSNEILLRLLIKDDLASDRNEAKRRLAAMSNEEIETSSRQNELRHPRRLRSVERHRNDRHAQSVSRRARAARRRPVGAPRERAIQQSACDARDHTRREQALHVRRPTVGPPHLVDLPPPAR
jgi:para-nitrobenzyl esterase